MDLATLTRSIESIAELAKNSGLKIEEQIATITRNAGAFHQRLHDMEQKLVAGLPLPAGLPAALNLGKIISEDAKLAQFRSGDLRHISIPVNHSLRLITRALLTNAGAAAGSPAFEYPAAPQLLPGGPVGFAARRLAVLEALPHTPVTGASAEVPRLMSNTDNAGVQASEGTGKNETVLDFTNDQLVHATVAHYVNASKQVIADSPLLGAFINRVMLFGVAKKFEGLIVAGNGTSDKIAGLTTKGTPFVSTADKAAEVIGESMTALIAAGHSPDLVILNPFDWFDLISDKDNEGRYLAGGWAVPIPGQLWGIRAIPSPALDQGDAVVLDTQQTAVFDREQANVSIGYAGDQFKENEVTILAELRGQLAVYDPTAVHVLEIPVDSP